MKEKTRTINYLEKERKKKHTHTHTHTNTKVMSLANQVYVLSGALPSGKSRKDKTAELVAAGATVGKSVTKSTTHL